MQVEATGWLEFGTEGIGLDPSPPRHDQTRTHGGYRRPAVPCTFLDLPDPVIFGDTMVRLTGRWHHAQLANCEASALEPVPAMEDLLEELGPPAHMTTELRQALMDLVEADLIVWFRTFEGPEGQELAVGTPSPQSARSQLSAHFHGPVRTFDSPWATSDMMRAKTVLEQQYDHWGLMSLGGRINRAGLSQLQATAIHVPQAMADWIETLPIGILTVEAAIKPLTEPEQT